MSATAERLIELFNDAKAIPAGAEREQFLAGACGVNATLRRQMDELLAADEEGGDFLKPGAAASPEFEAEFARLKPEEAGDRIGYYKLLEQIGQGGFGTVWVAEQERPMRRRVALKIIKLGMDTKEVIARFEQERQALAVMDHPNIAKVFDAGATATGRPYFVLELVRGIKITEYCDQANLSTVERLQLFIAVCQAVQHAHQKGIIHRDLKPSNILVTLHDGVPVPKVIDFGVAKATQQQRLTDLTVYTQFEQMVGTPLYMSPEQAEMSGLDIDTRSDIYSLGVLLYELLTGRTPFDPEELMRQGLDEIRRTIREQEPKKPSTFVQTMALDLRTSVARHRQADGAKLAGLIRGDLDWIVMKALEKDRARRYATANALGLDIKRHLDNEPVLARSPNVGYKVGKFIRKHKRPVAASAGVILALVGGLTASTILYWREQEQHRLTEEQRTEANTQRKLAEDRLAEIGDVQVLLGKNLRYQDPAEAVRWLSTAAESGHPLASAELGLMVASGRGVKRDMSKAADLFKVSTARGLAPAAMYLGECYMHGKGVEKDTVRGLELLKRAADAAFPPALNALGNCYYKGEGLERDYAEALRLFKKASDLRLHEASGNLAVLYINGHGVPRNPQRALELVYEGAHAGNSYCMYLLARCFEKGMGLEPDESMAQKWYKVAADAGSVQAKEWLRAHSDK